MRCLSSAGMLLVGALAGCGNLWGITTLTVDPGSPNVPEADAADSRADASRLGVDAAGLASDASVEAAESGPTPCPPLVTYCDDFDHGVDPGWSPQEQGMGTIGIDSVRAHSGTSSLHAHAVEGSNSFGFFFRQFAPSASAIYARVYAYVQGTVDGNVQNLWNDPQSGSSKAGCSEYDLDGTGGDLSLSVIGSTTTSFSSAALIPTGRWACLEWKLTATPTNHVTLSVDGAPVWDTDLTGVANQSMCSFDGYALGLQGGVSGTVDVFYDDLEIGPEPLGCP